jgi:subtilase family serine protease
MRAGWGRATFLAGLCLWLGATSAAAAPRVIPPAGGCTNPAHGSAFPTSGSDPGQVAAAYDVTPLWNAGFRGQGESVALILPGDSLVTSTFDSLSACYGPFPTPTQHVVAGHSPNPGGEGIEDPMMVLTMAPRAKVYMFETGRTGPSGTPSYARLFRAALNPGNTGGRRVDAISISFGHCETGAATRDIPGIESALRLAASVGVPVFASAGDSGAAGCLGQPVDTSTISHAATGLAYPGSSPLVTSVGGTEFKFGKVLPSEGFPMGGPFTELVWRKFSPGTTNLFASGGGRSKVFHLTDAPWERQVGITGHAEDKPDITALASGPKPFGFAGTSASSPLMAGAIATLDGYLHAHGAARLGMLNPTLYRIGSDPSVYASVFNDIRTGNNIVKDTRCCTANRGYDLASGLGSLNIKAFGDALLHHPSLRVPWTTLTLTPEILSGSRVAVAAVTNSTLAGAHLFLKVASGPTRLVACSSSPCVLVLGAESPVESRRFTASAEVGPSSAKPDGAKAIVSRTVTFTVKGPVFPGCPPGARRVLPPGTATIAKCPVGLPPG